MGRQIVMMIDALDAADIAGWLAEHGLDRAIAAGSMERPVPVAVVQGGRSILVFSEKDMGEILRGVSGPIPEESRQYYRFVAQTTKTEHLFMKWRKTNEVEPGTYEVDMRSRIYCHDSFWGLRGGRSSLWSKLTSWWRDYSPWIAEYSDVTVGPSLARRVREGSARLIQNGEDVDVSRDAR